VLLTGVTGFLGSLVAAKLLREDTVDLVCPVRGAPARGDVIAPIEAELAIAGRPMSASERARITLVALPPLDEIDRLEDAAAGLDARLAWPPAEIIHCAGCLDYFDAEALEKGNVELTQQLVAQARRWGVRRFVFLSTAFSGGYSDQIIPESIHEQAIARRDPTDYTRSKRQAEWIVAGSGVPFLIIRPSIVIGSSQDGHYSGKRYGLYQLWMGMERLIFDQWRPVFQAVGPRVATHFVHQDVFQEMFIAAWRHLPPGSVFHAVSAEGPTLMALWSLWLDACLRPGRIEYFQQVADLPVHQMDRRQRSLMALASVNLEIATSSWRFETTNLARLERMGYDFTRTALSSIAVCQQAFIDESATIRAFIEENRSRFVDTPEVIEMEMVGQAGRAREAEVLLRRAL
jgi:nucleoside-diphosphate-sugar epimerase